MGGGWRRLPMRKEEGGGLHGNPNPYNPNPYKPNPYNP